MNLEFRIFGTPYIFDLYQAKENELSDFQLFYDGSKENTKLTIRRMASGQVSYTYLRYNLISGGMRLNSFFGMSVVFQEKYCTDPISLYQIFDAIYQKILQEKKLLEKIEGNTTAQAKYLVNTFADAESEVIRIETRIRNNLSNVFFDKDFYNLTDTILPPNGRKTTMSDKDGKEAILKAMEEYSIIEIEITEELDHEIMEQLNDLSAAIKGRISDYRDNVDDNTNIDDVRKGIIKIEEKIEIAKKLLQPYLKNQQEKLLKQQFDKNEEKLNKLKTTLANRSPVLPPPPLDTFSFILNGIEYINVDELLFALEENIKNGYKDEVVEGCLYIINYSKNTDAQKQKAEELKKQAEKKKKSSWFDKIKINKSVLKYAAMIFGVIGIVAALFLSKPEKEEDGSKPNANENHQHLLNFDSNLSRGYYDNAWNALEKLRNNGENVSNQQHNLINSVNTKIEELKNTTKEDDLRKAKQLLVKSVEYGNTDDITQDTIDITESIRLIQATKAYNEKTPKYEYVKSLCDNILSSQCTDNIKKQAKTLSDNAQTKIKETGKAEGKPQVKKTEQESAPNGDCKFEYQIASGEGKKNWQTSKLMEELERRYKQKSYQVVIDGCYAIIQNCSSYKTQAEELKIKAEAAKNFQ